jgi:hypothetical protein
MIRCPDGTDDRHPARYNEWENGSGFAKLFSNCGLEAFVVRRHSGGTMDLDLLPNPIRAIQRSYRECGICKLMAPKQFC